ncbi:transcriptional regulator [Bradyrhizobium sp. SSBR45G]|uniref:GntR family transcriptional regulator n=1 Tax=unclassified Bradyrhizobium TaxID=2631580 RepID=UPI0023428E2C|nr:MULTISPECIES: GntR family transcriptional regulator [unclassified Bradyrhizobium]GLH78593.1 transcriptional regulator [Bradyrhizobium sp. SSBR45G]GLH86377.1 transcriptional regulator [Bradyrhizobium sp. SSBR45R]
MTTPAPRPRLKTRFKPARLKLSSDQSTRPLARLSLHDQLVAKVREMIVDGELAAGAPLPERMLCETFGVSRTPLREAFKILAAEGLIELRPHRTPVVTPIDISEIAEIFDVMVSLDAAAGRAAAARATADDIARLDVMHAELVALHGAAERGAYFRLNQQIHTEITTLAGNGVLLNIWSTLHASVFRARAVANYDASRWDESLREHEAFMALLRARDAQGFAQALSEHTRKTGDSVLRMLDQTQLNQPTGA